MEPSIPKSEFKLPAFQNEKEKYAVMDIAARVAAIAQYNLNKLDNPQVKVIPISPEAKSDVIPQDEAKAKLKGAYQKLVERAIEQKITTPELLSTQVSEYGQLVIARRNAESSFEESFYSIDADKKAQDMKKQEEEKREVEATDEAKKVCSNINTNNIDSLMAASLLVSLQEIAQKYEYKDWKEVAKKGGLNDIDIKNITDACEEQYQIFTMFTLAA